MKMINQLVAVQILAKDKFDMKAIRTVESTELKNIRFHIERHNSMRDRMSLLYILRMNFNVIIEKVEATKTPGIVDQNIKLEFNRLLMNYLSTGYALREHLKTHIKRDLGRKAKEDFVSELTKLENNFEYSFVQDFRNFVQHCGFPIGHFNRSYKVGASEAGLTIVHNKSELLQKYNGWDKSNLQEVEAEEIELIEIFKEYQKIIDSHLPNLIINSYKNEIQENLDVFSSLHLEVQKIYPKTQATVIEYFDEKNLTCLDIPLHPLKDLFLKN